GSCSAPGERYHPPTDVTLTGFPPLSACKAHDAWPILRTESDSMREIIFDTETTGLDPREDRIIELGCVELVNRFPTGRTLHQFINPEGRSVHPDAHAVHGISDADLADKPVFGEIL